MKSIQEVAYASLIDDIGDISSISTRGQDVEEQGGNEGLRNNNNNNNNNGDESTIPSDLKHRVEELDRLFDDDQLKNQLSGGVIAAPLAPPSEASETNHSLAEARLRQELDTAGIFVRFENNEKEEGSSTISDYTVPVSFEVDCVRPRRCRRPQLAMYSAVAVLIFSLVTITVLVVQLASTPSNEPSGQQDAREKLSEEAYGLIFSAHGQTAQAHIFAPLSDPVMETSAPTIKPSAIPAISKSPSSRPSAHPSIPNVPSLEPSVLTFFPSDVEAAKLPSSLPHEQKEAKKAKPKGSINHRTDVLWGG